MAILCVHVIHAVHDMVKDHQVIVQRKKGSSGAHGIGSGSELPVVSILSPQCRCTLKDQMPLTPDTTVHQCENKPSCGAC